MPFLYLAVNIVALWKLFYPEQRQQTLYQVAHVEGEGDLTTVLILFFRRKIEPSYKTTGQRLK